MDHTKLTFFALKVNGHDAAFFNTPEEAIEELSARFADSDDEDSFAIERVHGIWELTDRTAAFEDYSDDWMEDTLDIVKFMVERAHELEDKRSRRLTEEQKAEADKEESNGSESSYGSKD